MCNDLLRLTRPLCDVFVRVAPTFCDELRASYKEADMRGFIDCGVQNRSETEWTQEIKTRTTSCFYEERQYRLEKKSNDLLFFQE